MLEYDFNSNRFMESLILNSKMESFKDKEAPVPTPSFADAKAEKRHIIKNLLIVSFAFLLLFTAFQSLSNLQSSLNRVGGLGVASLSVIYGALIVSCLFVPPLVIDRLGCKWTIAASMSCYCAYIIANYYATWATMIPTSILLGFAAAPLWSAKCAYLTTSGIRYGELTKQTGDAVVTRFFGIFFLIFQSGQIWGNLISSLVLQQKDDRNSSMINYGLCGANDCPGTPVNGSSAADKTDGPDKKIITLMSIYLAVGILAVILISTTLDKITILGSEKKNHGVFSLFIATARHLKDRRMQLLIPLTMYSGLEQGFVYGDFTKSFVTCVLGVDKVGYVMICFGVTDAILSYAIGKLSEYTGRPVLMFSGAALNLGLMVGLLIWKPVPDDLPMFFVAAAMWGVADSLWQTQVNAFYGYLFPDNQEAAFSNYRLWESLGFVIAFAYSGAICVSTKLYILIAVLIVAITFYGVIERMEHTKRKTMSYAPSMQAIERKEELS
ncbi:protein unc-93 homolog A-like isoform X1 [Rhopilema esculentum]|uniref:protein unc-93 homolog A-like isoform X1 n=2 Tax=Rhopilema esculentum TaxID=499914 RepID=UPI0031E3E5EB